MAKDKFYPCYCPWCRKLNGSVGVLGVRTRIYHCHDCNNQFLGAAWSGACPTCRAPSGRTQFIRSLNDGEGIPGNLCPECQVKSESMAETVAAGGVMFRCKKCMSQGVIDGDTDFARDVRLKTGKAAPEEVGVEVEDCPLCTPDEVAAEPASNDGCRPHILPLDHDRYSDQQSFREISCRSREEDPDKLLELAVADYEDIFCSPPSEELMAMYREWAPIEAKINAENNADPYMQGLEAAEKESPEALAKFMEDHPVSEFNNHGVETPAQEG